MPLHLTFSGCLGNSTNSQQGAFNQGYQYSYETLGDQVKITYKLLDTDKIGVIAYLWQQNPFTETPMIEIAPKTFSQTVKAPIGSTINYAVKFAYAGGLAVSNYYTYKVGSTCNLGLENNDISNNEDFYFQNPASEYLNIKSKNVTKIEINNLNGSLVLRTPIKDSISIGHLPKGNYLLTMYFKDKKITKKLIIQ